jgi:hypothetical protein
MDSPPDGTKPKQVYKAYACKKHGIRKSACLSCVYEEALSVIENARKDPVSSIEELDKDEAILKQAQGQFCPGHNRLRCTECNWFVPTNIKKFAWDTAVKYTNFSGRICQHKVWKMNCTQAGCNPRRLCVCGQWKKKYHVCEASAAAASRAAIESVALPAGDITSASAVTGAVGENVVLPVELPQSQSTASPCQARQVSVEKTEKKSAYKKMSAEERKAFNVRRKERRKQLQSMGKLKKTNHRFVYRQLSVEQKKAFCKKVYEARKRRMKIVSKEDRMKILDRSRSFYGKMSAEEKKEYASRQNRQKKIRKTKSRDGADTALTASSDDEKVDFEGKKRSPQLSDVELSENHLGEEMMEFSADYTHFVEKEQSSSEMHSDFMELSQQDIDDEFETFLTTLASEGDSAPAGGGD